MMKFTPTTEAEKIMYEALQRIAKNTNSSVDYRESRQAIAQATLKALPESKRYTLELAENEQTKALGLEPLGYFIVDNVNMTTEGYCSLEDVALGQAEVDRLNSQAE